MAGEPARNGLDSLWLCTFEVDRVDSFLGFVEIRRDMWGRLRVCAPFRWYRQLLGWRSWLAGLLGRRAVRARATFVLTAPVPDRGNERTICTKAHSFIGALDAVVSLDSERLKLSFQSAGFAMSGTGQRRGSLQRLRDYRALAASALEQTEEHIFDPSLLEARNWRRAVARLLRVAPELQDDLQFWVAFRLSTATLGRSHLTLRRPVGAEGPQEEPPRFAVESARGETVIRITAFDARDWQDWHALMLEVATAQPRRLVFDLRNCRGGDFTAALPVSRLFSTPVHLGYLLGRQGVSRHGTGRLAADVKADTELWLDSPQALAGLQQTSGIASLWTRSVERSFEGEVVVLTSSATASAAEAFCSVIKSHGRGQLVGENTAGALLSSEMKRLAEGWVLNLPTALYLSPTGTPVEGSGIAPDIATPASTAHENQASHPPRPP